MGRDSVIDKSSYNPEDVYIPSEAHILYGLEVGEGKHLRGEILATGTVTAPVVKGILLEDLDVAEGEKVASSCLVLGVAKRDKVFVKFGENTYTPEDSEFAKVEEALQKSNIYLK